MGCLDSRSMISLSDSFENGTFWVMVMPVMEELLLIWVTELFTESKAKAEVDNRITMVEMKNANKMNMYNFLSFIRVTLIRFDMFFPFTLLFFLGRAVCPNMH